MLIRTFVLKVINNERKILTNDEIIIALQNKLSGLSLKCAKNQNCGFIRTYGDQVFHLLIYLSSLTFALDIYTDLKRGILLKKIRNHSESLKLQQNIRICLTNLQNREALRTLHMQLEIPSCLGYGLKSFNL